MPERKTLELARKAKQEGKAPTTQAGEFVREEMEHIREVSTAPARRNRRSRSDFRRPGGLVSS